jgi:hypothetical protein
MYSFLASPVIGMVITPFYLFPAFPLASTGRFLLYLFLVPLTFVSYEGIHKGNLVLFT